MTRQGRRRLPGALDGEPGGGPWERVPSQMVQVGGGGVTGGGAISPMSVKILMVFFFIFESQKEETKMFLTCRCKWHYAENTFSRTATPLTKL